MNDLEFAQRISPRIGELYGEAKRSRHLFPAHALIRTRGLASLCCDILRLGEMSSWPDGLDHKIGVLVRARQINTDTSDVLHKLRRWGNAAAHPEASLQDDAELPDLAGKALAAVLGLLETVFRQQHCGAEVPAYEIVDAHSGELSDVCYRALMDNSPSDQYQVAMLLRRQLAAQVAQTEASEDALLEAYTRSFDFGAMEDRALDMLRYASDNGHPPARYEYGLALVQGKRGDDKVAYGANLIAMARRDGDIDALAWYGHAALYGLHDEPVDYERAREDLERAAAEDHPLALSLLSLIYRDGLGVAPDAHLAFDLTLRAAHAGYSEAQYEAAVALFEGAGTQRDEQAAFAWLQQASDAGLPEAQLAQARFVRRGVLPGGADEAERLLLSARQRLNEAGFELADLYMAQQEPSKWIAAANLVQMVYETALHEQNNELADRSRTVAPDWIARLERLRHTGQYAKLSKEEQEGFIIARFLFDGDRRPCPDRRKRLREFMNTALAASRTTVSGHNEKERLVRKLASDPGPASAVAAPSRRSAPLAPVPQRLARVKVGRNEPCPCGSGRKYKVCCA